MRCKPLNQLFYEIVGSARCTPSKAVAQLRPPATPRSGLRFAALLASPLLLTGCGPCGAGAELLNGVPYFVLSVLAAILCVFGYYVVRDGFRFGRMGISWFVAAIALAIFSGAGYFFGGPTGILAGAPFLVAFSFGKYRRKYANKRGSTRTP